MTGVPKKSTGVADGPQTQINVTGDNPVILDADMEYLLLATPGPLPFLHIAVYTCMGGFFSWVLCSRRISLHAVIPFLVAVILGLVVDYSLGSRHGLFGFLTSLGVAERIYRTRIPATCPSIPSSHPDHQLSPSSGAEDET